MPVRFVIFRTSYSHSTVTWVQFDVVMVTLQTSIPKKESGRLFKMSGTFRRRPLSRRQRSKQKLILTWRVGCCCHYSKLIHNYEHLLIT
jgi:hypothetical protein